MDMEEKIVANVSEFKNRSLNKYTVNKTDILISKINDKFYAVGNKCTHFGGPLNEGIFCEPHHVRCPWHKSKFNLKNGEGDIEDCLPSFDNLPSYKISVNHSNGDISVSVPNISEKDEQTEYMVRYHREPSLCGLNLEKEKRTFVIIGGGASGFIAMETLRSKGFHGRIVCISKDTYLPYDRTDLSKGFLSGDKTKEKLPLKGESFYKKYDIEILLGKEISEFDTGAMTLKFKDGSKFPYDTIDGVILASGSSPRVLQQVKGHDADNVYVLRTREDCDRLLACVEQGCKNGVIIGGSFIGTEVASSLKSRNVNTSIVAMEQIPFENVLGKEIGQYILRKHKQHGTSLYFGNKPVEFKVSSESGNVTGVLLESGETVECDFVVMAVGIQLNTQYVKGLKMDTKDHSIIVDKYLCADVNKQIYAVGDICRFPDSVKSSGNDNIRIEHWKVAEQQGRTAAINLLSHSTKNPFVQKIEFTSVPYFWTKQLDFKIEYIGYSSDHDNIVYKGDDITKVKDPSMAAFFTKGDKIQAIACVNAMDQSNVLYEMFQQGLLTSIHELQTMDFKSLTSSVP